MPYPPPVPWSRRPVPASASTDAHLADASALAAFGERALVLARAGHLRSLRPGLWHLPSPVVYARPVPRATSWAVDASGRLWWYDADAPRQLLEGWLVAIVVAAVVLCLGAPRAGFGSAVAFSVLLVFRWLSRRGGAKPQIAWASPVTPDLDTLERVGAAVATREAEVSAVARRHAAVHAAAACPPSPS